MCVSEHAGIRVRARVWEDEDAQQQGASGWVVGSSSSGRVT